MKRKTWLILLAVIAVLVVLALLNFGKVMDLGMLLTGGMKHKDPTKEAAAFTLTADAFSGEFKANKDAATAKYMDKTILVSGKVTDVQAPTISLGNVACTLDSAHLDKLATLKAGDEVKIQGQFVGYNDLLDELDLSKCGIK